MIILLKKDDDRVEMKRVALLQRSCPELLREEMENAERLLRAENKLREIRANRKYAKVTRDWLDYILRGISELSPEELETRNKLRFGALVRTYDHHKFGTFDWHCRFLEKVSNSTWYIITGKAGRQEIQGLLLLDKKPTLTDMPLIVNSVVCLNNVETLVPGYDDNVLHGYFLRSERDENGRTRKVAKFKLLKMNSLRSAFAWLGPANRPFVSPFGMTYKMTERRRAYSGSVIWSEQTKSLLDLVAGYVRRQWILWAQELEEINSRA